MIDAAEVKRQLAGRYGSTYASLGLRLRGQGSKCRANCLFRDHTRRLALSVNVATGDWKCFACGVGGDVFTFYGRLHHVAFPEALRAVADLAGVVWNGDVPRADARPVPLVPPEAYTPPALAKFAIPNAWGEGVDPIPGAQRVPDFTHVASYRYLDADARLVGVVDRLEHYGPDGARLDKTFRPRLPTHAPGAWRYRLAGRLLPLYRWPELCHRPEGAPILVAEGEKDVEQVRRKLPGWMATTAPGGAAGWRSVHTEQVLALTAAEPTVPVLLLPDDDDRGGEWLATLRATLGSHRPVRVLHARVLQ